MVLIPILLGRFVQVADFALVQLAALVEDLLADSLTELLAGRFDDCCELIQLDLRLLALMRLILLMELTKKP